MLSRPNEISTKSTEHWFLFLKTLLSTSFYTMAMILSHKTGLIKTSFV